MEHYLVAIAVTAGIYALMALGMNVIWGMAGLINLGLVGFFAVGAYVSGLLTLKLGLPIAVGMAAGAAAAAAFGAVVALVTVRLRGDYLAIVTLGFAETLRIVMSNELWIANGTDGLSGIPGPFRGTLGPHLFNLLYLGIVRGGRLVLFFLVDRLVHSPFGRVLRAIRDDEEIAQVAGKNVVAVQGQGVWLRHRRARAGGRALRPLHQLHRARPVRAAADALCQALAPDGWARQQQGSGARRRVGRFLSGVDALPGAADPGPEAVQGAARASCYFRGLLFILRFYAKGLLPERIERRR